MSNVKPNNESNNCSCTNTYNSHSQSDRGQVTLEFKHTSFKEVDSSSLLYPFLIAGFLVIPIASVLYLAGEYYSKAYATHDIYHL